MQERIDATLAKMDVAVAQVNDAGSNAVKRPSAELDLLTQLELVRNSAMELLRESGDRTRLVEIFGGCCRRIGRVQAVLDSVQFSRMNARDQRLHTCRSACLSVEQVLLDLGFESALQTSLAREKARLAGVCPAFTAASKFEEAMPETHLALAMASREIAVEKSLGSDSESEGETGTSNEERHKQDMSLLEEQHRRLRMPRYRVSHTPCCVLRETVETDSAQRRLPASLPSAPATCKRETAAKAALEDHGERRIELVMRALVQEQEAIALERAGKCRRAIQSWAECAGKLAAAIAITPSTNSNDSIKLVKHRKSILKRVRYLETLKTTGHPPRIPVEEHICVVQLDMPLPLPENSEQQASSSTGHSVESDDWKPFAACAALGAAGGFLVLGPLAVTAGVAASVVGAAAGVHCASRSDSVGVAARKVGGATVAGVESVGRTSLSSVDSVMERVTASGSSELPLDLAPLTAKFSKTKAKIAEAGNWTRENFLQATESMCDFVKRQSSVDLRGRTSRGHAPKRSSSVTGVEERRRRGNLSNGRAHSHTCQVQGGGQQTHRKQQQQQQRHRKQPHPAASVDESYV